LVSIFPTSPQLRPEFASIFLKWKEKQHCGQTFFGNRGKNNSGKGSFFRDRGKNNVAKGSFSEIEAKTTLRKARFSEIEAKTTLERLVF
jgi:hypothetical protein